MSTKRKPHHSRSCPSRRPVLPGSSLAEPTLPHGARKCSGPATCRDGDHHMTTTTDALTYLLPVTEPPASAPTVPGLTGLTVLARGGYATVYRAEQESVGRPVAVKIENRTLETERDRRRFLREARAAGRMSGHPHVIDLFDAGVTAD